MPSYHLSVKTVKRSAGRSAVAAAAYRAGERLECARDGLTHDYTRKQGIEDSFILAPDEAPDWAADRSALWNAAEDRETRRNSVTAREWELALPSELSSEGRAALARDFAQALVDRYGIAADVAIHAPHREGDQRNHHAHILTTTRVMGREGLEAKTRILDAAKTGGEEIAGMRELWAGLQNVALERHGLAERVDHRTLEAQREDALSRGDDLAAMELDRLPEIKLGPAANAMERRAQAQADRVGEVYTPVTERGAQNHAIRERRSLLAELRARAEQARTAYRDARAQEASRLDAVASAARALFTSPQAQAFAASVSEAVAEKEAARQRALEEERARERQRQLEATREAFVERMATAWADTARLKDPDARKAARDQVHTQVREGAPALDLTPGDLTEPINVRAKEIYTERQEAAREAAETERLRLEQERAHSLSQSRGLRL